jgi:magnesium-transporting ATPase (P-type)
MLCCKGASESIAPLCSRALVANGEAGPFTPRLRNTILAAQNAMAEQGLRVLALASRPLDAEWTPEALEQDLVWAGLVGVQDPPRREVQGALHKCREAGVRVIMTTGDHPGTALAIAREVGLVESASPAVITGEALRRLPEVELRRLLGSSEVIFGRIAADQKLRIVEALKQQGHVVPARRRDLGGLRVLARDARVPLRGRLRGPAERDSLVLDRFIEGFECRVRLRPLPVAPARRAG